MKKTVDIFEEDFGFSFVEEDFEEVKSQVSKLTNDNISDKETISILKSRLETMHGMINPFLENLKKNPDKTTIYWPNRTEKIGNFQEKLSDLMDF